MGASVSNTVHIKPGSTGTPVSHSIVINNYVNVVARRPIPEDACARCGGTGHEPMTIGQSATSDDDDTSEEADAALAAALSNSVHTNNVDNAKRVQAALVSSLTPSK